MSVSPNEGMRVIRRRAVLLVIGALASVAIGLLLGRMRKPSAKTTPEPIQVPRPTVKQRSGAELLVPKRDRSAKALLKEAEAARNQRDLSGASGLYAGAVKAATAGREQHARALLGHAVVLIELKNRSEAIGRYRAVRRYHPKTEHARQAKVALQELGALRSGTSRSAKRKPRVEGGATERVTSPSVNAAAAPPASKASPPTTASALSLKGMSAKRKCAEIKRRFFGEPKKAVEAFKAIKAQHPNAPCVYWQLGQLYQNRFKRYRSALEYYRRFLELAPSSPKRPSVERRIADIEAKLGR